MVIFPNTEVRLEYDNHYDYQMIELVDNLDDDYILLVNPIDDTSADIMSLPNYGLLGQIKLKINVPNGKTRIVIEGLERVELSNYIADGNLYRASYKPVEIIPSPDEEKYINVLIKVLKRYIDKVPYMGNAIMSQLNNIDNFALSICQSIVTFLGLKQMDNRELYRVVVGSYSIKENAQNMVKQLEKDGYKPYITKATI